MIQVKWNNGCWKIFDVALFHDIGWRNTKADCVDLLTKDKREFVVIE